MLNGKRYSISKRDCFLFRPGDITSAIHNPEKPLTVTYIHFSVKTSPTPLAKLPSLVHFDPSENHEHCLNRYIHLMLNKLYNYKQEATMVLALLLLMFERQSKMKHVVGDQSMNRIMMDIAATIMQDAGKQHKISDLANQAHLSPRYFSVKFKEVMGQTIESYIIDKRIERATYLLRIGMTVSEVADALGYRSIYYFSRQFKQKTGVSPSAWHHPNFVESKNRGE